VLADALPADRVEHNVGAVPAILPGGEAPRMASSPGEVARTIETNGSWMVLKNIEIDPEYRALLNETLDEVAPLVADREGGMRRREGFIFLSAPDSTTPAHVDPEHNFLLQVRGTKTMVVGRFPDPDQEQQELERFYGGGHRNIALMPDEPREFPLNPGDGVYVPVNAPHLVRNGPTVSVSLSITWRTPSTVVMEKAHVANARLRRLGLSPSAPGRHPRADRVKAGVARTAQGVGRRVAARRS
jgi:ribosomal protein L16 Arg81 hydroxylase